MVKLTKLERAEREIIEYATLENIFKKLGKKTYDMWLNGFGEYTNEQLEQLNLIKELNKTTTQEGKKRDETRKDKNEGTEREDNRED